MTLSPVRSGPHRPGRREQIAIDNRVRFMTDLGTERKAQYLAGSNVGGGYGHLNWLRGSNIFHPPSYAKQFDFDNLIVSRREGKAVVLISPKKCETPRPKSQA